MNPFNLPACTEYAYAHSFMPHPYLFTSTATMRPPIQPTVAMETNFPLAELQVRNDQMVRQMKPQRKSKKSNGY